MTDDDCTHLPAPGEAATPNSSAGDWTDGANWLNLVTQTTGTVPVASEYVIFQNGD